MTGAQFDALSESVHLGFDSDADVVRSCWPEPSSCAESGSR